MSRQRGKMPCPVLATHIVNESTSDIFCWNPPHNCALYLLFWLNAEASQPQLPQSTSLSQPMTKTGSKWYCSFRVHLAPASLPPAGQTDASEQPRSLCICQRPFVQPEDARHRLFMWHADVDIADAGAMTSIASIFICINLIPRRCLSSTYQASAVRTSTKVGRQRWHGRQ